MKVKSTILLILEILQILLWLWASFNLLDMKFCSVLVKVKEAMQV